MLSRTLEKTRTSSEDILDSPDASCQSARLARSRAALVCPHASIPIFHPLPSSRICLLTLCICPEARKREVSWVQISSRSSMCRKVPCVVPYSYFRGGSDNLTTQSRMLFDFLTLDRFVKRFHPTQVHKMHRVQAEVVASQSDVG